MTEKTTYICDYCGDEYDEESDCERCEEICADSQRMTMEKKWHLCVTCEHIRIKEIVAKNLAGQTIKGTVYHCKANQAIERHFDQREKYQNDCDFYVAQ